MLIDDRLLRLLRLLPVRVVGLIALQLLHSQTHDVLHLVEHFQVDVFIRLFSVNFIEYALFADVLAALKLEKLGLRAALTLVCN